MFGKIGDIIDLFRKGSAVANKEAWADSGNAAALITPAIMAAVKLAGDYGIGIQLSTQDAATIASGIVAVVLFVTHNITNKHAGILSAKPVSEVVQEAPARTEEQVQSVSKPDDKQAEQNYFG